MGRCPCSLLFAIPESLRCPRTALANFQFDSSRLPEPKKGAAITAACPCGIRKLRALLNLLRPMGSLDVKRPTYAARPSIFRPNAMAGRTGTQISSRHVASATSTVIADAIRAIHQAIELMSENACAKGSGINSR